MIKVNLLKDAGKKQQKGGGDSSILDSDFRSSVTNAVGDNNALVKRILLLILPIALVYGYTWYTESGLQSNITALSRQSADLDTQVEALKPELDTIQKFKEEKNKLSAEVNAIKELSKKRYAYVKILDSLQSLIPEKLGF